MTQNKISPGIVINHVDRSFHVLIVTTYLNDPIFLNLELHASWIVILLEFMLNQTTEINYEWN